MVYPSTSGTARVVLEQLADWKSTNKPTKLGETGACAGPLLNYPLLCAACAPPGAWPHAPRPRDGYLLMPQRGIPFGNVNSAVTRKPNRS